jgi:hypothetical protein
VAVKRARLKKARAAKAAHAKAILEAGGKSRYAEKKARAVRGTFSATSPFCSPDSPDALRDPGADGLDVLHEAGLCSDRTRDALRGFRSIEEEWA